jgi:hypothetical protein
MVNLNPDNLLKLVKTLKQLGYSPKAPVKAEELADPQKRAGLQPVFFRRLGQLFVARKKLSDHCPGYPRLRRLGPDGRRFPGIRWNAVHRAAPRSDRAGDGGFRIKLPLDSVPLNSSIEALPIMSSRSGSLKHSSSSRSGRRSLLIRLKVRKYSWFGKTGIPGENSNTSPKPFCGPSEIFWFLVGQVVITQL